VFRIVPVGDSALSVEFEEKIDPGVNARAIALARSLQQAEIPGVRDVVPTYRTVAVFFDPLRTNYDALLDRIERDGRHPTVDPSARREPIRIPVCYGGDLGPDLEDVARFGGITPDEVIAIHTSATYRVFMLGFVPGFAYMGVVDPRIAAPRHATPRVRVDAGSVGIAGMQTGIYPSDTPGGWQLIGRTPVRPFDANRPDPFLMKAGDHVRFHAIDRRQFKAFI
jgi:inhibitor of KinA